MKPIKYQAADIAHQFVKDHIQPGDFCIDCTAGNGNDTVFLAELTGPKGKVLAMDIQRRAVENTEQKLDAKGYSHVKTVLDSHTNLDHYARPSSAACILFNLGWLPGSDHTVKTNSPTTIIALQKAIDILLPGGIIGATLYSGKDLGSEEKNAVLQWAEALDTSFTVLTVRYHNRKNDPPVNLFIIKGAGS